MSQVGADDLEIRGLVYRIDRSFDLIFTLFGSHLPRIFTSFLNKTSFPAPETETPPVSNVWKMAHRRLSCLQPLSRLFVHVLFRRKKGAIINMEQDEFLMVKSHCPLAYMYMNM